MSPLSSLYLMMTIFGGFGAGVEISGTVSASESDIYFSFFIICTYSCRLLICLLLVVTEL